MAQYCLPQNLSGKFIQAIYKGDLKPNELREMSSAERRKAFADLLGEENAKEVNLLFERKMLLKDQKKAMVNWAMQLAGLKEPVKRDLIHKINSMDKILSAADERAFLSDLAEKRLGVAVTAEEGNALLEASKRVADMKEVMDRDINNFEKRVAWGEAYLDLKELVDSFRPDTSSNWDKAANILQAPKSLMSSLDFSAPLNQGWGMVSNKEWWQGLGNMFAYGWSEANYKRLKASIISHPNYEMAVKAKLGLTELGDKLSLREEAIQSNLAEKANQYLKDKTDGWVPNVIKGSNRAYNGFLNYVRFERFNNLVTAARLAGEDVRVGTKAARDLAKVVNDFTGRGALGKNDIYANTGPFLNSFLWAPRKISASIEMLRSPFRSANPFSHTSMTARKAAMRQLTGSILATASVLMLAKQVGFDVDLDPTSTDFLKIQLPGDVKLDVTGGNAIYTRLIARYLTQTRTSSTGNVTEFGVGFGQQNFGDELLTFGRNKLSPLASITANHFIFGDDNMGGEVSVYTLPKEIKEQLIPMTMGSYIDLMREDPDMATAAISLSAIFGVGLQTPLPPQTKSGLTAWGDSTGFLDDPVKTDLDKEFEDAGGRMGFPTETIKGVKLTDEQYHMYIALRGNAAKQLIYPITQNPNWGKMPAEDRLTWLNKQKEAATTMAQNAVEAKSHGTDNDITKKSFENKIKGKK